MKKIIYFLFTLIVAGCNSPKTAISQKTDDIPPTYKRVLFVTDSYYTNQNIIKKLFDTEIKNKLTVSKINTKIVEFAKEQLEEQNKYADFYLIKNNLDKTLVLNQEEIQQNIDEEVLDKNIDLVITIFQKDIQRLYNKINSNEKVFEKDTYNATTNSSNLMYTYVFTGIDISKDKVVWKSEYGVQNADDLFNNIPKQVAQSLVHQLNENHLY
ncbi:hypothetical protein QVZ41_00775 [Wenyingzhuangia sp. chi5]|uniref:Lipoprotein n=1 Tax=Wenyingzhuangia gilva TaxID=3057677 RepID=A0ABT8VN35_9FLAO|nr:hypothetical protein [Wenyingzhuangia sp. chi5]MDO3693381.1 hypothetical protein [Wenyingzhuangia sp. chi5]